jgi:S1-C subfamily serine protease
MLAQTGKQFVEELRQDEETDFWKVARRLSRASYIRPLASRGIVGQIAPAAVIYDAETTHGGSGGPVLDLQGRVVAVNTAIIPEFGGSNIGIPAQFARRLLDESGVTAR